MEMIWISELECIYQKLVQWQKKGGDFIHCVQSQKAKQLKAPTTWLYQPVRWAMKKPWLFRVFKGLYYPVI